MVNADYPDSQARQERARVLRLIDRRIASLEELATITGHKQSYPFAELRALRQEVEEGGAQEIRRTHGVEPTRDSAATQALKARAERHCHEDE